MQYSTTQEAPSDGTKLTRALLTCGIIAGPFYIVVGLIQALFSASFREKRSVGTESLIDIRHPLH